MESRGRRGESRKKGNRKRISMYLLFIYFPVHPFNRFPSSRYSAYRLLVDLEVCVSCINHHDDGLDIRVVAFCPGVLSGNLSIQQLRATDTIPSVGLTTQLPQAFLNPGGRVVRHPGVSNCDDVLAVAFTEIFGSRTNQEEKRRDPSEVHDLNVFASSSI